MANDIDKKCPECGAKMTYTPADVTEGLWGCTQCNYQVSSETDKDLELLREHCPEMICVTVGGKLYLQDLFDEKKVEAIAAKMVELIRENERLGGQTLDALFDRIAKQRVEKAMAEHYEQFKGKEADDGSV